MNAIFNIGQFVRVRDSVCKITDITKLDEDHSLIELLPIGVRGEKRQRLVTPPERIEVVDPPDLILKQSYFGPIAPWELKHEIISSGCVRESDWLGGARFGRIVLEAYQLAPVLRVLSTPRPRLLIADDVGLGKTIEAGLCLLELKARGRAENVLVVVPPGLIFQWRDEMRDKFNLDFVTIENATALDKVQMRLPAGANPWEYHPQIITSVDYLKKGEVSERALKRRWDIIIVDEAHGLAESGTPQYPYRTARTRLGERLSKACSGFLLLTATPHNGYSHSFRSLIQLVEPTAATLGGDPAKVRERIERTMIRRLKVQIRKKGPDGKLIPAFPLRTVDPIKVPLSEREVEFFKRVSRYCSRTAKAARATDDEELVSFAMQIVKKRMLSSRKALRETIDHRLQALKSDKYVEEPPPKSELRDLQSDLPLSEAAQERVSRRVLRSAIPKDVKRRNIEKRALNGLKRELGRLPEKDPKIEYLIDHLKAEVLPAEGEKAIIFTEYLDTLSSICESLDNTPEFKDSYVILRGGYSLRKRVAIQEKFNRPAIRFLIATDAASEGLNLQQFCRRVIHFELPWNPNRLEQRNGRVDRYGQTRKPIIRYLYYPQSPEDEMLHLVLVRKIEEMQKDWISTPDTLGVVSGLNLEKRLTEIDAFEYGELQQRSLLKLFEDRTEYYVKNVNPLLSRSGFEEDEHRRIENILSRADPLLSDDRELERVMLERLGDKVREDGAEGVYLIDVPRELRGPGVKDLYKRATFRRSVATRFHPSEVEYINILHPLFKTVSREARLSLTQPGAISDPRRQSRLAARCSKEVKEPYMLATFLITLEDGNNRLVEEGLIRVGVKQNGSLISEDQLLKIAGNFEGPPGEVRWEEIDKTFGKIFEQFKKIASQAASEKAEEIKQKLAVRRKAIAEELRRDLDSFKNDRLEEIKEEEATARAADKQLLLFKKVSGFQAKRAAVDTFVAGRKEEISQFESVFSSASPLPLGILFIFPEKGHI